MTKKPTVVFVNSINRMRHLHWKLALSLICAACAPLTEQHEPPPPVESAAASAEATPPPLELSKAHVELDAGIASYENGSYNLAARQVQSALSLGLSDPSSVARAHKYLAFMHCVGSRIRKCREEFGKAIDADSSFSLSPAEAGHPTWGPVFRKLKASQNVTKKKPGK